jgi:hypothetical protein
MAATNGAINNVPQIYGNGIVFLVGSVVFGAAGAVATTKGKGVTVTKTGTGAYTLTTTANFNSVLACSIDFNAAGGAEALSTQRGAFATNNALTILTVNSSGANTNSAVVGNGFDYILAMSTSQLDQ